MDMDNTFVVMCLGHAVKRQWNWQLVYVTTFKKLAIELILNSELRHQ